MVPKLSALVFDAYGTLYDVHSVIHECEQLWPGKGTAVSQLWRAKQLEWTWQRSLMGRYVDFRENTIAALRYAATALTLICDDDKVARLMEAYVNLDPYPEVRDALEGLRPTPCAILSNGTPDMLEPLVANAGFDRWISDVISVDAVHIYKPTPRVYQLAVDRMEVPAAEIGFVSSNCWDACGAKSFGFHVFWINRTNAPVDALGAPPDHILKSLAELPHLVAR
jgi:2-haloacid dehalogenase